MPSMSGDASDSARDDVGDGVDGGVAVAAARVRLDGGVHHLEVAAEAVERT